MAVVLRRALLQQLLHQVGARHPRGVGVALLAAELRQRPAVGQRHDSAVLHLLVVGVFVRRHRRVDVGNADVLSAPVFELFLDETQRFFHIGHDDVHAHDVAGVHQPQVHVPHAARAVQLGAGRDKVVVHRHRRHPQVEAVRQQHDAAHLGGVLHILRQHQHLDTVVPHDVVQIVHRAAVVGQIIAGRGGQIAAVAHRYAVAALEGFVIKAVRQLAAADQQRAGHNIIFAHVGVRHALEDHPLACNAEHRQQIVIQQQKARQLADLEDVEHRRHHSQTGQIRHADQEQFPHPVVDVQGAVAALDRVAGDVHQRVQPRDGQERPDIPHEELAAEGADGAQRTRDDEHHHQQYKFCRAVQEPQQRTFVVMHGKTSVILGIY